MKSEGVKMFKHQPAIRLSITAIVSTLLISCASSSKEIGASYVSPAQYKSFNCEQLSQEIDRLNRRKTTLASDLDKKASNDQGLTAISAILFWPAAFALGGNQAQEAEYGRLKGEYDAVQQAGVEKNCKFNASTQLQTAKITNQTTSGNNVSAIDYYGQAEEEVDTGTYSKNLWAKALVEAEGDETKRKIKYIELRANQIYSEKITTKPNVKLANDKDIRVTTLSNDISGTYRSDIIGSGAWSLGKSPNIKVVLKQNKYEISGTFSGTRSGEIEGILNGDIIKFKWFVTAGRTESGRGEWKLPNDGMNWNGTWRSSRGTQGNWNLTKIE